ncbi:MAG: BrnA antitoxin family protein [Hyphomicrobiales bacterium]
MKSASSSSRQIGRAPTLELDDSFWKAATFVNEKPKRKTSIHLRVDQEILDHFRNQGPGHLTRMANILKAYVQASRSNK